MHQELLKRGFEVRGNSVAAMMKQESHGFHGEESPCDDDRFESFSASCGERDGSRFHCGKAGRKAGI